MRTRPKRVEVYLTEDEFKYLSEVCFKTKISKTDLLRYLLLGFTPPEAPNVKYDDLIYQLRCIGNNINQILRIARTNGILNPAGLEKHLSELKDVEQEMHDAFRINRKN